MRSRVPIIIQSELSRLISTLTDMFGLRLTAATAVCIRNMSEISGKKMLTLLHVSDELNHIIQLEMERRRRRRECTSHDNEYNELIVYNSSFSSWNEIIPLSLIIISIHFPSSSLFSLSLSFTLFSRRRHHHHHRRASHCQHKNTLPTEFNDNCHCQQ